MMLVEVYNRLLPMAMGLVGIAVGEGVPMAKRRTFIDKECGFVVRD